MAVEQLPGLHGVVSNFKSVRHAADIVLCPSHVARDQELKGVGQDDRALSRNQDGKAVQILIANLVVPRRK